MIDGVDCGAVRKSLFLVLVTLLALSGQLPARADGPLRLTIGVAEPIGSIDPATGASATAQEIWRLQYPALTGIATSTLDVAPGLASAWAPGDENTQWTYTIRPGATWSDGVPVTADDVVYSLDRTRDESWPYARELLDGYTADVVDDQHVRIDAPEAGALPALPLHVVPRHLFEAGTDVDETGVVGSGDWHVAERSENEVRLVAVDRPGRPALDEIVFRSYPDGDSLLDALRSGDVDVAAALPISSYLTVRDIPDVTTVHANDGDQWILRVRIEDPALRAVVARAIDRDALVRESVAGAGRAQTAPIVRRGDATAEPTAKGPEFAPGVARRRLQDLDPPPAPITFSEPTDGTGATVATALVDMLKDAGLEVERVSQRGDLELVRRNPGDDPLPELTPYTCAGDVWCDDAFDNAYNRYVEASDDVTRDEAVQDMLARLVGETAEIVLFAPDQVQAFRTDNVTGLLREPSEQRVVTFWPGIDQYRQVVAAQEPAGEDLPTVTFFAIAAVVVVLFAAVLWIAYRLGRSRPPVDGDVELAVDGEGVTGERSPT